MHAVPRYRLHSISAPCMYLSFFSQTPPHSVPLGVASQNGHTQTVERLLGGGANINHQDVVRSMHMLVLSHYKRNISISMADLYCMNSPNSTQAGRTALSFASWKGCVAVVQVLLKHQADVRIPDRVCLHTNMHDA